MFEIHENNSKTITAMTQKEFEELTKRVVKPGEYSVIESLYMAAGDMDKKEFCKEFKAMCAYVYDNDEIELRQCLREISKHIDRIEAENRGLKKKLNTRNEELAEFLVGKAHAYSDTDFRNEAVKLVGEATVVKMTIEMGLPLWEEDKEYLCSMLKNQGKKD